MEIHEIDSSIHPPVILNTLHTNLPQNNDDDDSALM
jgi:hypothetical protein